ncbi:multiubiquitin domain-containing protein [Bosea sp. CRIB-10]|uniref:multiubiquitin domain-containing protein n=1 Tax=Bosea sp. CRIB-10 TaxID=378404 RepID=UPI001587B48B|nr:multiubiquitin domain-containing protein [Bosea sp. CRIB-10]
MGAIMADRRLTYEFEVDGTVCRTRDPILDGRQIRAAANLSPPADFRIVEIRNTSTRAIALEDRVHLDANHRHCFRSAPGDRTYSFLLNDAECEWPQETINEAEIRAIGKVDDDLDLVLDGDIDRVIERGKDINLGGKAVERVFTRPSMRTVTILVNGREKEVARGTISFEALILLAFPTPPTGPNVSFTVTYRKGPDGNPEGSLTAGHSVRVKNGMVFNVRATDKS